MEPVTVWWAVRDLARPGLVALLDPVERGRRDRYLREADRDRFTLGVAITRLAAGELLGTAPDRVPITRTCADCDKPHGPPVIEGGPYLSVSHSGDRVAVAVSPYGPVGVDVEEDSDRISDDIARLLLADDEPRPGRAGLLAYWTRKEALLKATGDGLRVPLAELHVTPPGEPPRLRGWDGRPGITDRLGMYALDPGQGYAACLALLDHPRDAQIFERKAVRILDGVAASDRH